MKSVDVALSVIVPVYNVEKYLTECLDSIVNQTFKDVEIIIVDDGSTDNSGLICDDYAARYNNVRVYHKTNGGLSSARNYGISKAGGKYLAFIDSDDFIEPNMLEVLINNAAEYNADISMCNYCSYFNENKKIARDILEKSVTAYRESDVLLRLYTEFSAWNKIYRSQLFNDIGYPEGKLYEDARTTYLLAAKSNCAVVSPLCLYNYRQRASGIMGTFSTENFLDRIKVWDEIYAFVKPRFPADELSKIIVRKNRLVLELLRSILSKKQLKANKKTISKLVCNLEKPLFSNKSFNAKEKLSALFFIIYSALFINKKEM